jgi:hypothetical protein
MEGSARPLGSAFAIVGHTGKVRNGSEAVCSDTRRVCRLGNLLCWLDRPQ